jgi:hypothetical protein
LEEAMCTCCDQHCTIKELWGSLLKPLLTYFEQQSKEKKLFGVTIETNVDEGNPCLGFKNIIQTINN